MAAFARSASGDETVPARGRGETDFASFGFAQTNGGGSAWWALYSFWSRLMATFEADIGGCGSSGCER